MSDVLFDWNEMDWEEMNEYAARKVVTLDNVMFVLFRLRAGSNAPHHSHPHEQLSTVIAGRLIAHIGDEERELGPMGGYCVPPDVPHGVTVLEDCLLIDAFSPIREDFLGP